MQVNFLKLREEGKWFDLIIHVGPHNILCHRILLCQSSDLVDMLLRNSSKLANQPFVNEITIEPTLDISANDIKNAIDALYLFSSDKKKDVTIDIATLNYLLIDPAIIHDIVPSVLPHDRRLNESEISMIENIFDLYPNISSFVYLYQFYYAELSNHSDLTCKDQHELCSMSKIVEAMKDTKYLFGKDLEPSKKAKDSICIHFPACVNDSCFEGITQDKLNSCIVARSIEHKSEGFIYIYPFRSIKFKAFDKEWTISSHKDEDGYVYIYVDRNESSIDESSDSNQSSIDKSSDNNESSDVGTSSKIDLCGTLITFYHDSSVSIEKRSNRYTDGYLQFVVDDYVRKARFSLLLELL